MKEALKKVWVGIRKYVILGGIAIAGIATIAFIIVRMFFSGKDKMKELRDVVIDHVKSNADKKEAVIKKYEEEIETIRKERENNRKKVDGADDDELDDIVKRNSP